jgi:Zn-dependent protease with chaperone function
MTTRLAYELRAEGMDDLVNFMAALDRKDIGTARRIVYYARTIVLLPLLLGIVITKFLFGITLLFLLGWLLARSWHTRRYLADATAVQLTRNPDALARALVTLRGFGGVATAARQLDYLFIVGGEAARARAEGEVQQALANLHRAGQARPTLREMAGRIGSAARVLDESRRAPGGADQATSADAHGPDAAIRLLAGFERKLADAERGTFADSQGIVASFHPRLDRRLKRLRKLGATVA